MQKFLINSFLASMLMIYLTGCSKTTNPEFYYNCKLNGQDYTYYGCTNCLQCEVLGDTSFILSASTDYESIGIWINDNRNIQTTTYEISTYKNPGGGGI